MESGYFQICNRCSRSLREENFFCNLTAGPCESKRCFLVRLTPVDQPLQEGQLPPVIQNRLIHDIMTFGQAFVEKSTYERISHGEKTKFDQYIHYPAEQVTIGELKTWGKRQGFTKYDGTRPPQNPTT